MMELAQALVLGGRQSGRTTYMLTTALALAQRGHDVEVVAPRQSAIPTYMNMHPLKDALELPNSPWKFFHARSRLASVYMGHGDIHFITRKYFNQDRKHREAAVLIDHQAAEEWDMDIRRRLGKLMREIDLVVNGSYFYKEWNQRIQQLEQESE